MLGNRLIDFSMGRPLTIYGVLIFLTLTLGVMISNIKIDTDPENMLPETEAARIFHNQVKTDFSLDDIIVVGAVSESDSIFNQQSLTDIKQLTDHILTIEGVNQQDLNSLSTIDNVEQGANGSIRFEWMMAQSPEDEVKAKQIGAKAARLPFVVNSLVSGDQKAATIYVPIVDKNQSYQIAKEIKLGIDKLSAANQYYITGLPVAEDTFGVQMFVQMGISAPLAAAVIYLLMLYFFRSASLVLAPMLVAMATVIMAMGAMIGMGYTVHIMSSMIPIFLMPIAVVDSVHLMSEFADRYRPGEDPKAVIKKVTSHLFKPMLFTSITSSAGFFSLVLTPIPPVQVFGAFVGSGILLAFIITIVLVPAYVSRMSDKRLLSMQEKLHKGGERKSRLAKVLVTWGTFSVKRSKLILISSLVVVAISLLGISKIEINDNPIRWFKSEHPIRVADRVLNHHFAGTYDAHLVFEYSAIETQLNNWRHQALAQINQLDPESEVGKKLTDAINSSASLSDMRQFILLLDDLIFEVGDETGIFEALIKMTESQVAQLEYFKSPEVLNYIEKMQQSLGESELIGKSNSMVDLIKTVNRELHSGEAKDFKLPESQNGVSQTLLQFQSSHRPNDLWHFVTPDYARALIWLQMTSGDNQDMRSVVALVEQYVAEHPLPEGVTLNWAGKAYLNLVWQERMVTGMFSSLLSAFVIVFMMMCLLFRSVIFGLLAMLPLSITILFMYGLIGWTGKYYDMPIAVLSALTLGLSIDFAIHFLQRTRTLYEQTGSWPVTVKQMFEEPARAISRNALVIALGFTPLLLAPLVPYITVGAFLAAIMAVSALVTLLVLPACMQQIKSVIFKDSKVTQ